jgi:hypothetical protein
MTTLKATAYMKPDVLEILRPQDCFFAFATKDKHATVPLFTWEQVKVFMRESNESKFDAEDYIDYIQEQLDKENKD